MDKLFDKMSVELESVDEEMSPTQPVLLSQTIHLLNNKNDPELLREKQKMMPSEKLDLQSLLSESSSSITEEEMIDTAKPRKNQSDDEEISEPSQAQQNKKKK
jgi:hypothetical protein